MKENVNITPIPITLIISQLVWSYSAPPSWLPTTQKQNFLEQNLNPWTINWKSHPQKSKHTHNFSVSLIIDRLLCTTQLTTTTQKQNCNYYWPEGNLVLSVKIHHFLCKKLAFVYSCLPVPYQIRAKRSKLTDKRCQ